MAERITPRDPADAPADAVSDAIAEMRRKPDAQMALELIEALPATWETRMIIDAYFEALED
jgi:hypothetical protein